MAASAAATSASRDSHPALICYDTEARREPDLTVVETDDGLLHLLPQTFREFSSVACVRLREENGELLSAYASRYIGLPACTGNDPSQAP